MYLHIGKGESLRYEKIIGIFDLDTATVSGKTKQFISKFEKEKNISYADSDLPRSFVLYEDTPRQFKIKLSRISAAGLASRAENGLSDTSDTI